MIRDRSLDQRLDRGLVAGVALNIAPVRSAPITVAPSARNSSTVALPIPEPAPVTIATLP